MTEAENLLVLVGVIKINFEIMLYFVKRNHKLKEYRSYFKKIQTLCLYLDKLSPEFDRAKPLIWGKKKETALGEYLEQKINNSNISLKDFETEYSSARASKDKQKQNETEQKIITFSSEDFNGIDLEKRNSFSVLKNFVRSFKGVLDELKNYESFQGRIKFRQFAELFNFEDYIYEDKQFQYSIISNYNKRLIPEFISASFAELVYENHVSEDIRRNMEQYFIAIMSNMDYHNYAHISQLKSELNSIIDDKTKNVFYVLGATPQTFSDIEYAELINERIERAEELITKDKIQTIIKTEIWIKEGIDNQTLKTSSYFTRSSSERLAKKEEGKRPTTKLTLGNLDRIYTDIKLKNLSNYNLFLVTSTFHILKTAIEVERHFYNDEANKPDNIIFVGNEKFFDLAHNKQNCTDKLKEIYHKKKLKSFLYELFLHSLDRNAVKP